MSCPLALRNAAAQRDVTASRPFHLGELWQQLCGGAWIFRDTFETDERYLAILQASPLVPPRPLPPHKLRLLECVLLGSAAKVVAMENQRALSSITSSMQACIRAMGLPRKLSQASVLLTMAARASRRPEQGLPPGRLSELVDGGETYLVVSAVRPDLRLPAQLSLAERAVLRSLLEGNSYAQISGARATSRRTVANQLATAFRKLGVSGRRETIEHLIEHSTARAS